MSLTERLSELVRAAFSGIWIESHEHGDALTDIAAMCKVANWCLATWDIEQGLRLPGQAPTPEGIGNDPLAAVKALSALTSDERPTLLVLVNFHRYLQSAEIVQALTRRLEWGKQAHASVIVLSPIVALPAELEKQFVIVEHELPQRHQLLQIARGVATEDGELPSGLDLERILDAGAGLTRYEAEAAYSLSLVRHGKLRPETLWEQKSQLLKKSGQLTLHRGQESFADLGGLDALKAFCLRAMRRPTVVNNPLLRSRGVLLLSPPGCGKSQFAKSLGNETGRPTLALEMGSLMGSLVGESERNLRQALRIVEAMSPCVLFIDELEKSLAGASGTGDSGVSARMFGHFLTWLNDRTCDAFVVGTCNDIGRLPPEFARAERFDAVVFVDLPDKDQRAKIWNLYLDKFGLDPVQPRPDDQSWSGAEIRACCRLAALLDLPLVAAAQNVVPIAMTAGESVERLRAWASGRCLNANKPEIYRHPPAGSTSRRRVSRDASSN
jgi:SpoVK/Ycf46/Vps4 family AAA+-type ATPase